MNKASATNVLQATAICPACSLPHLVWEPERVRCNDCAAEFPRDGKFVDFVQGEPLRAIESVALETWGKDLHAEALSAPAHFHQIKRLFPGLWQASLKGTILEIGCGSGTDACELSAIERSASFLAFDLGANVAGLSRKFADRENLTYFRANALRIPISGDSMDLVYSFGVFHHTSDPSKCLLEARRVLKEGGALFFYLYSAHEDNYFKYAGVLAERALMRLLARLPGPMRLPLLYIVSVPCIVLFSWPARLLNLLGRQELAAKFPMHWGSTPSSILPDLKDRLLAPINHRFTRKGLESLLETLEFLDIRIQKTSSGLFGYCTK